MGDRSKVDFMADKNDPILVTRAGGFIGSRVVQRLRDLGFQNVHCFTRPSSNKARMDALSELDCTGKQVEVIKGNLLSPQDLQLVSPVRCRSGDSSAKPRELLICDDGGIRELGRGAGCASLGRQLE
jgi:NAD dependent epimerase/dehydratase family